MNVNSVMSVFQPSTYANSGSYNSYQQPASVAPSAYGSDSVDVAFYDVNRPASKDGAITKMFIGGLTGYKYDKGGAPTAGSLTQFMMNSAGTGAAISGTISLIKNVASLSYGKQSASTTVSNVLTDTIQGSVSAVGGGLGAYGTNAILKALGAAAGTPMTLATIVGGAVGAVAANQILNTEKLRSTF